MTSPGSENKNQSILLALRSLSLELVNEDAEKYPPNSTVNAQTYLAPPVPRNAKNKNHPFHHPAPGLAKTR